MELSGGAGMTQTLDSPGAGNASTCSLYTWLGILTPWQPQGGWTLYLEASGSKNEHPSAQGRSHVTFMI